MHHEATTLLTGLHETRYLATAPVDQLANEISHSRNRVLPHTAVSGQSTCPTIRSGTFYDAYLVVASLTLVADRNHKLHCMLRFNSYASLPLVI